MRVILCTDGGEILESFWLHSNLATDDKASIAVRIHIEERYSTYDDERSYVDEFIDALKLSMAADQS
jgi:hypothetical protein